MDVKLNERKCVVNQATKDYAQKKAGKLGRYFKGNTEPEATVAFRIENKRCRAEITLRADGTYFRAEETTTDMMASIDAAVSSIERQIRKNKTRLSKRLHAEVIAPAAPEVGETDAEDTDFEVVRTKRFPIKPMSVEEAILQMKLLKHTFFVFRNEDNNGSVAVVYARNDSGYGLIEDDA